MSDSATTFARSATYQEALARAATAWGIELEYWDIWGRRHEASLEVQKAILASLGVASDTIESLDAAIEQRLWEDLSRLLPPTLVLGESDPSLTVSLPAAIAGESIKIGVRSEDGGV